MQSQPSREGIAEYAEIFRRKTEVTPGTTSLDVVLLFSQKKQILKNPTYCRYTLPACARGRRTDLRLGC